MNLQLQIRLMSNTESQSSRYFEFRCHLTVLSRQSSRSEVPTSSGWLVIPTLFEQSRSMVQSLTGRSKVLVLTGQSKVLVLSEQFRPNPSSPWSQPCPCDPSTGFLRAISCFVLDPCLDKAISGLESQPQLSSSWSLEDPCFPTLSGRSQVSASTMRSQIIAPTGQSRILSLTKQSQALAPTGQSGKQAPTQKSRVPAPTRQA